MEQCIRGRSYNFEKKWDIHRYATGLFPHPGWQMYTFLTRAGLEPDPLSLKIRERARVSSLIEIGWLHGIIYEFIPLRLN